MLFSQQRHLFRLHASGLDPGTLVRLSESLKELNTLPTCLCLGHLKVEVKPAVGFHAERAAVVQVSNLLLHSACSQPVTTQQQHACKFCVNNLTSDSSAHGHHAVSL